MQNSSVQLIVAVPTHDVRIYNINYFIKIIKVPIYQEYCLQTIKGHIIPSKIQYKIINIT